MIRATSMFKTMILCFTVILCGYNSSGAEDSHPLTMNFKYLGFANHPQVPHWDMGKLANFHAAVGMPQEIDTLVAFKKRWPNKLGILYMGWWARDPESPDSASIGPPLVAVFPGHWLLYAGCQTEPITPSDTIIYVSDISCFREDDDVQLRSSVSDWSVTEEVYVKEIGNDIDGDYIKVARAQYLANAVRQDFPTGAYAATHASGDPSTIDQWRYNYCLVCPRDTLNRRTIEVMADFFADKLDEYPDIDGYTFDTTSWSVQGKCANADGRGIDADADGVPDCGIIDGESSWGLGLNEWIRQMRAKIGADKLLLGDGGCFGGLRAYYEANGFEAESFPEFDTYEEFAGAFDIAKLWYEVASPYGRVRYLYTKDNTSIWPGDSWEPQPPGPEDWKFRIGAAAAALLGAFHTYSTDHQQGQPQTIPYWAGVYEWDEYFGGTLNTPNYLGGPLAEFQRITSELDSINLVSNGTFEVNVDGWSLIVGESADAIGPIQDTEPHSGSYSLKAEVTKVAIPPNAKKVTLYFFVDSLIKDKEYTLIFWAKAQPSYSDPNLTRGMVVRIEGDSTTLIGFQVARYWREYYVPLIPENDGPQQINIYFGQELGALWIDDVELYDGGADLFYREFENGIVLLNMTRSPYTFQLRGVYGRLESNFPINQYNPNDGTLGLTQETVDPFDARFLIASTVRLGDVNGDGEINILDVVRVVNIILEIDPPPTDYEWRAADCNGDENVDVLDVVGIVNVILDIGTCSP